jgi:hypothetical protein
MAVTATVPILPGAAVNQERSYASYPQSRRRGSSGTVVATRLVLCLNLGRIYTFHCQEEASGPRNSSLL